MIYIVPITDKQNESKLIIYNIAIITMLLF